MSDTNGVMSYFAKIGLDTSEWMGGVQQAQNSFLAFYRDVTVSLNMTSMLFDKFFSEIKKFGDVANHIMDLSYQTGIATDKIQQLQYAAALSGTNIGVLDTTLSTLTRSMESASDATSVQAKAFSALGVSVQGKSPDEVFSETAAALVGMDNVTRRNSLSMDIYGRSYKDILPLMQTYIEKKAEIAAHPKYSKEELQSLNDSKIAWESLIDSVTIYSGKLLAFVQGAAWKRFTSEHKALTDDQRAMISAMDELNYYVYGIIPEKLRDPANLDQLLPKPFRATSTAAQELIDKYMGMTDAQIDLEDATDALTQAQKDQADALAKGDVAAFNSASRSVQLYKNRIDDLKTSMNELAAVKATTEKSLFGSWDVASVVGSAGSEMQLFLQKEMEAGVTYQEALNNWANGAPTATNKEGTLGAAMGAGSADTSEINDSEKEQNNLLKSDVRTQASFNKNLDRSQSKMGDLVQEGKDLNVELTTAKETADRLGDLGGLSGGSNYNQQLYDETITDKMRKQWEQQEADGLTHYGSMAEMSRVRSQAEIYYMTECVNFAGNNPIIQNKIIESATGPDWVPVAFTPIKGVTLTPADFSSIKTLIGGSSAGSGSVSGTGQQQQAAGGTAKAAVVTSITINNPQGLSTPASIQQASKALANLLKRGGAT